MTESAQWADSVKSIYILGSCGKEAPLVELNEARIILTRERKEAV